VGDVPHARAGYVSDLHTLTGAYALHALSEGEEAAFRRHLAHCATCRQRSTSSCYRGPARPGRRRRTPSEDSKNEPGAAELHFDLDEYAAAQRHWTATLHAAHTAHNRDLGAGILTDLHRHLAPRCGRVGAGTRPLPHHVAGHPLAATPATCGRARSPRSGQPTSREAQRD
jgi:hypothetical protein